MLGENKTAPAPPAVQAPVFLPALLVTEGLKSVIPGNGGWFTCGGDLYKSCNPRRLDLSSQCKYFVKVRRIATLLTSAYSSRSFDPAQMRNVFRSKTVCFLTPLAAVLLALPVRGQSNTGELRLRVTDPHGLGLKSQVELLSKSNQYHSTISTDEAGARTAKRLAFGLYVVQIREPGFG
jgi:hypothetical protein